MKLVCYAHLLSAERQIVAGESLAGRGPREECGMAICESNDGCYIFTCDDGWNVMGDSLADSGAEALEAGERMLPGIGDRWRR
jgi:hypothetical protein